MSAPVTTSPPWIVIRPLSWTDRDRLSEGVDDSVPPCRHRRFLAGVASLTDVQRCGGETLVAIDPETDEGIGVASCMRSAHDPQTAEITVAVADGWQGRGVGTALVAELVHQAGRSGIRRVEA